MPGVVLCSGTLGRSAAWLRLVALVVLAGAWLAALGAVPSDPAGWQTAFQEDFEHGDGAWTLWAPPDPSATGEWRLQQDGGSWVYYGAGHAFATVTGASWDDLHLRFRAKIAGGTFHLWFHHIGCSTYTLDMGNSVGLTRTAGCSAAPVTLAAPSPLGLTAGDWHDFDLLVVGGRFRFYLDGQLRMDVTDAAPLLRGSITLESLNGSDVLVDDMRVTAPVVAPAFSWNRTGGPMGGVGYDVRMRPDNPDILFATDIASGASLSEDGGRTWKPSNAGITTRAGTSGDAIPVFCLTIDPNNPNIVWAGTQNLRGIYRSSDGGRTWVQKDHGVMERNGITFRGFTVDPRDSKIVYAAGEVSSSAWADEVLYGRYFDRTKGVVYKTVDGGENWTAIWRGDNLARYVWINPQHPDTLYVSTGFWDREAANTDVAASNAGGVGVLKSVDAGRTWQVLGKANGLKCLYVGSLFMHPANPDILLAGAGSNAWPGDDGVYLTTDGGRSWQLTLPTTAEVTAVEFSTTNPSIAYAASTSGFYRSTDGGTTWVNMRPAGSPASVQWGPPGVPSGIPVDLQADPRNPNRVFSNSYKGGNALSEDGGSTWVDASRGYTGASTRDVAVDPRDPRRVYAVTRSGPFRSQDSGGEWDGLYYEPAGIRNWFPSGWSFPEWDAVAVDPRNPDRVLFADELNGTILLSTERGNNWRVVFRHPQALGPVQYASHGFQAIAFARSNARVVYAGMRRDRKSVDGGNPGPSFGIYKSTDGGETWGAANDANTEALNVSALAVDPNSEDTVYAGTTAGVFATTDGGRSWQARSAGLQVTDIRAVAIDPTNSNILYAGAQQGGLYRSTDRGRNWVTRSAGMDAGAVVLDIAIDRTNPQVIYAADAASGVYRSENGGALWVQINHGLGMRAVIALSLSDDGGTLYAATEGGGVYRLDIEPRVSSVSAASFETSGTLAPEAIASGFGENLAGATEVATAVPLPATLGGTSVAVIDSAAVERMAPLFFVSAGQINYLIPAGTAAGLAAVRVFRQGKVVARGTIEIAAVGPGLFTANASGAGVPAAVGVRVSGGVQAQIPVFQCGAAAGSCVPAAIDLGPAGDEVYLLLFGTGIRGNSGLAGVSVKIGGVDAEVAYAGPQGGFVGLDQINVKLPRSLAGRGEVDLVLTLDGKAANTVRLRIN